MLRPFEDPVPIETWLRSEIFSGPEAKGLRPYWYDRLVEFFRLPTRKPFIFTGAARGGKTYAATVLFKRYIYEVGLYYNTDSGFNGFPTLFGLSETTLPKLVFLSLTSDKADSTGLDRLIRSIDKTPYFQQPGRRRSRSNSVLSFPWVQVMTGSNVTHLTGEDTLGVVLDEASLRHIAQDSQLRASQELYLEMRMRSANTFSLGGVWAGFSGLISTAGTATSFTDLEVQKAKRDPASTFLVEAAVYDVNPAAYSSERFAVYTGDGSVPAFIVDSPDDQVRAAINASGLTVDQYLAERETLLVYPPVNIRNFYEENIDYALQNMSGITRLGSSLFMSNKSVINGMFNPEIPDPVPLYLRASTNNLLFLGLYDTTLVEEYLTEDQVFRFYDGEPVYCSFDISRVNDHTGFSALYFSDHRKKIEAVFCGAIYHDRVKSGNEIDQVKLVALVTHLYRLGVNIVRVTADGYSSDYVIQRCKLLLGEKAVDRYSVDKNPASMVLVSNYAKLRLYNLYENYWLKYELEHLIADKVSGKIDHPPNTDGSNPVYFKDCCDSLAAATIQLSVGEDLSYETMQIQGARADIERALGRAPTPEDSDDFEADMEDPDFPEDAYESLPDTLDDSPRDGLKYAPSSEAVARAVDAHEKAYMDLFGGGLR